MYGCHIQFIRGQSGKCPTIDEEGLSDSDCGAEYGSDEEERSVGEEERPMDEEEEHFHEADSDDGAECGSDEEDHSVGEEERPMEERRTSP